MSATFGSAKSPTVATENGATKPQASEADQSKMSARMKRFTDNGSGEGERIVGGKQEAAPAPAADGAMEGQDDKDKDDDLEVVI